MAEKKRELPTQLKAEKDYQETKSKPSTLAHRCKESADKLKFDIKQVISDLKKTKSSFKRTDSFDLNSTIDCLKHFISESKGLTLLECLHGFCKKLSAKHSEDISKFENILTNICFLSRGLGVLEHYCQKSLITTKGKRASTAKASPRNARERFSLLESKHEKTETSLKITQDISRLTKKLLNIDNLLNESSHSTHKSHVLKAHEIHKQLESAVFLLENTFSTGKRYSKLTRKSDLISHKSPMNESEIFEFSKIKEQFALQLVQFNQEVDLKLGNLEKKCASIREGAGHISEMFKNVKVRELISSYKKNEIQNQLIKNPSIKRRKLPIFDYFSDNLSHRNTNSRDSVDCEANKTQETKQVEDLKHKLLTSLKTLESVKETNERIRRNLENSLEEKENIINDLSLRNYKTAKQLVSEKQKKLKILKFISLKFNEDLSADFPRSVIEFIRQKSEHLSSTKTRLEETKLSLEKSLALLKSYKRKYYQIKILQPSKTLIKSKNLSASKIYSQKSSPKTLKNSGKDSNFESMHRNAIKLSSKTKLVARSHMKTNYIQDFEEKIEAENNKEMELIRDIETLADYKYKIQRILLIDKESDTNFSYVHSKHLSSLRVITDTTPHELEQLIDRKSIQIQSTKDIDALKENFLQFLSSLSEDNLLSMLSC